MLPVVRRVESQLSQDDKANHEYLPVAGLTEFRSACIKLLLGDDSKALDRVIYISFYTLYNTWFPLTLKVRKLKKKSRNFSAGQGNKRFQQFFSMSGDNKD